MARLFIIPFIVFGLAVLSFSGCNTLKKDVDSAEQDLSVDSSPEYPDGLEKEIEERGEP